MLFVISPAKNMNYEPVEKLEELHTEPRLAKDTKILSGLTRKLKEQDLKQLMGISDNLAELNRARFKAYKNDANLEKGKAAAFAFNGDVYQGLEAASMSKYALAWAQNHLRILSGFYGLLRPLDAIQPYRLEMGIRLPSRRGNSLYDFWGNRISKALNEDFEVLQIAPGERVLVNLASNEYFKAIDKKALKAEVITCQFKEIRDGKPKMISFLAKKARGLMARYAADNKIVTPNGLKGFNLENYTFDEALSDATTYVFTRAGPE